MLYVCQLDYPDVPYPTHTGEKDNEKGKTTTIKSSGCGLCSAVMVADRLLVSPSFNLNDALELSMSKGANHASGTDYRIFAPAFAEKLGLELEVTGDIEKLTACLKSGGCAVMHCRPHKNGDKPYFSLNGGHYVVVISVDGDGRFAVLDPSYKEGKFDSDYRRDKVRMNGLIAHCGPEVLLADTEDPDIAGRGFYLFKRK